MQESTFTATPGQLLLAARQARSLAQADIAKHLRLSVQAIHDIEHDAYAELGVRTFVRGYLCAYARIVGISDEQILTAFNASGLMPQAVEFGSAAIGAPVTNVTRQYARFQPTRYVRAGAVALVILGAIVLWMDKKDVGDKMASSGKSDATVAVNKLVSAPSDALMLTPAVKDDSAASPSANLTSADPVSANTNTPRPAHQHHVQKHSHQLAAPTQTVTATQNGFVHISSGEPPAPHTTYTVSSVTDDTATKSS